MNAEDVIRALDLEPLLPEGGFFRETYRSTRGIGPDGPGDGDSARRAIGTAIYYLLTPDTFSALHRLPGDEVYHHYLGDPVEMLLIDEVGTGKSIVLGSDLEAGMRPQVVVPGRTWQGSRVAAGGAWALLGTTMSPGFDFADYEAGDRATLVAGCPAHREMIRALTREG